MSIKPGLYDNISLQDYHKDPAISRSDLMLLRQNPMKFRVQKQLIQPETDAFNIGTAAHAAILEPEKYWGQVAVAPTSVLSKSGARNTKAYKEWAADPERADKAILTQDQSAMIHGMVESMYQNPEHSLARALLTKHKNRFVEQSIFFEDATFGFMCKARPDIRLGYINWAVENVLLDLKTCQNASEKAFARDAANYGYDVQAAWYLTGASRATGDYYQNFIFVCIEKEPPFCVAVYRADQEMLDAGRSKIRPLIELYNDCITNDRWPGYPDKIVDLSLPGWAL